MNWYKTAKSYIDVGHKTNSSHILWYSPDGVQVVKSPKSKQLSHSKWYEEISVPVGDFSGRYDVVNRELSVVGLGYRDIPKSLMNNLMRVFSNVKTIYVYTEFLGTPEVIRVASKREAKSYLDIGHKNNHILWFSPDGINIQKSNLDTFDHSRWDEYKKYKTATFDGRYDVTNRELSVICPEFKQAPKSLINNLMRAFPDVKTIYVFDSYNTTHETIRVASKRIAQTGEWWIVEGRALFADSDIGDMGHEQYVINHVQSQYAYDEFGGDVFVDWEAFKKELAMEAFEEQFGKRPTKEYYQKYETQMKDLYTQKLKEMGMTDAEYLIAEGKGDARLYGMVNLGWKRVKGNNIQTNTLTTDDLKDIANGLYDINNDLDENSEEMFTIEVIATGAVYRHVPYKLISDRSPSMIREFQDIYAKSKNWYKMASRTIPQIAQYVRKNLVKCYDDKCLREKCLPASRQLKAELIKNGYDAIVVRGLFRVDNPDPEAIKDMDTKGLSPKEIEEAKYTPLHYWVEVGDTIIDITASQFNNELDEPVNPIEIGTCNQLERYKPIHKDWQ